MSAGVTETVSRRDEGGEAVPVEAAAHQDAKAGAVVDAQALRDLLAPVRTRTLVAQGFQVIGSAATVVPFAGVVELGRALLASGPIDSSRVWMIVWVVTAGLGVRTLFSGIALTITHFADQDLQDILRRRLIDTLSRVPLGWFGKTTSGEVRKAAQNDVHELHYLVAHAKVETTGALATPIFGLGYCFYLDWRLGLLAMATLPIYIATYAWMTRDMTVQMDKMNKGIGQISATIVEFISGVSVVKTFGQTGKAHKRFATAADDFNDQFSGWVGPMLKLDAATSIAISAPVVLLVNLAGGYWFVDSGWVSPIELLGSTVLALILPSAIITVGFSMHTRQEASAAAGRLIALYLQPVLATPADPKTPTGTGIVFDDVSFSYDDDNSVLKGITATVAEGQITALVGPSGSGKSTLAALVPRFHDVGSGSVRIGGVDVRNIDPAVLFAHVGFVLQDVQLLGISVADNIRLGRPNASDQELISAAKSANIHHRITELPRGYESVVGEDALLSGGEAQRVSIARALLADTPILVLDEATAFADPESEAQIQSALSRLLVGRTVLVIAHRLGSITQAHNIIVLEEGVLVEQGRHEDLIAIAGRYSQMWDSYQQGSVRLDEQLAQRGDIR